METTAGPGAAVPVTLQWLADDDNGLSGFACGPGLARRARVAVRLGPQGGQPTGRRQGERGSTRSLSFAAAGLGRLTVSNSRQPAARRADAPSRLRPQGANALLRWATASEKNNDHFDVEASADGRTFRRIGQVAGHGSSTQPHEYQLVDPAIARYAASPVYYRLRQVDGDGTFSYSPVRPVAVSGKVGLALFPNPTSRATTLVGATPGTAVTVYDAVGRLVLAAAAAATGTAQLAVGHYCNLAVFLEQHFVGFGYGAGLAVEVEEAAGVHGAHFALQALVPVNLVDERVPGEAKHGHALLAHSQNVDPLLPEPGGASLGVECWFRCASPACL